MDLPAALPLVGMSLTAIRISWPALPLVGMSPTAISIPWPALPRVGMSLTAISIPWPALPCVGMSLTAISIPWPALPRVGMSLTAISIPWPALPPGPGARPSCAMAQAVSHRPVNVGFVVDRVAMGQGFVQVQFSFHHHSPVFHTHSFI